MKHIVKGWMALFLIAIFMISAVPVAFAEETVEGEEVTTETTEDTEEDSEELKQAWRNRRHQMLEQAEEKKEAYRERRAQLLEKQENLKERRAELKAKYESMQERWIAKVAQAHPKAQKIIDRLENAVDTIEERVAKLEEAGIEVENIEERIAELESLMQGAQEHLDSAKEAYTEARELWNKDQKEEAKELFQEARRSYNAAVQDIREAVRMYKSIAQDVREAGGLRWFVGHPEFTPGEDFGVYVWNHNRRTNVCISGDGENHKYHASVTNDDGFKNVYTHFWDQQDTYQVNENSITFSGGVNPHFDCIGFTSLTKEMTINVEVDGQADRSIVFLGNELQNPDDMPFTWTRLGGEYPEN